MIHHKKYIIIISLLSAFSIVALCFIIYYAKQQMVKSQEDIITNLRKIFNDSPQQCQEYLAKAKKLEKKFIEHEKKGKTILSNLKSNWEYCTNQYDHLKNIFYEEICQDGDTTKVTVGDIIENYDEMKDPDGLQKLLECLLEKYYKYKTLQFYN